MSKKPYLQLLYDEIGPEKIEELVNAFYPKVYADPELIPIFNGDIADIMEKQRLFLTQFMGGPTLYSNKYGRPAMKSRHLHHEITPTRARSWLRCMKEALKEIGLEDHPAGEELYYRLTNVAVIMINTPEEVM